ncbi:MAG: flagellar hook-associated protein FlgK [Methylococcales bacterium]
MVGSVLGTAVSGLMAFKRSLETTGNNIANANTEGYSRQRVEYGTRNALYTTAGYVGQGVDVTDITRSYDQFLSSQLRSSTSAFGEVNQYQKLASQIDTFVADSASGLAPAMKDFFSAMNKVANDPSSIAARQVVLSNSETLAQRFNSMNSRFQGINAQVAQSMTGMTDQVNTYASAIANLNGQIATHIGHATNGTQQPNDLLDQRDVLLGKLSELVDVSVVPQTNGMASVFIGKGQALVLDSTSNSLGVVPSAADPQKLDITLKSAASTQLVTSQVTGGALGGTLRFREEVLEPARQSLSNIAETMTQEVNQVHKAGFDLDGGTGNDLFSYNIASGQLSTTLIDPRKIAAATTASSVPGDNRNALALANLENTSVAILQNGAATSTTATFQDAYGQLVSKVGSLTHAANVSAAAQESLLNNAKTASENVSGVNLDEEAANLMKFQQSYQAAAQVISTSKGLFDTLLGAVR